MHREERFWLILIVTLNLGWLTAIPLVGFIGRRNADGSRHKVAEAAYVRDAKHFVEKYRSGGSQVMPEGRVFVDVPPGDVYLIAERGRLTPSVNLVRSGKYRIHVVAVGSQHSFLLRPQNLIIHARTGEEFVFPFVADISSDFFPDCNAYCSYNCAAGILPNQSAARLSVPETPLAFTGERKSQ